MFARLPVSGKIAARLVALLSLAWLAACEPVAMGGPTGGPSIDPGAPVQVALLVPGGSGAGSDAFIASNLENAARMAIADLNGARIDLRIYNTGATAAGGASAATEAANDGAKIILGPLYADAANAAGVAVAGRGINVLAFSNNPTIAGGNVFILGPTFENTASRLVSYGRSQGINRYLIAHGDDLQGQVGRDAIASAVRRNGATLAGVQSYAMSQTAILNAAPGIAAAVRSSGAQAVFMTGGANADLPILATALPEAGIDPATTRFMGLTRWSATPQALSLPGLQGGLFALPDQGRSAAFEARYAAAYGAAPHPLASLAYDGIAAIGALVAAGDRNALTGAALTTGAGFQGSNGIFRLRADGTNQRALAVATIRDNRVVVVDPAPRSFGGAGS